MNTSIRKIVLSSLLGISLVGGAVLAQTPPGPSPTPVPPSPFSFPAQSQPQPGNPPFTTQPPFGQFQGGGQNFQEQQGDMGKFQQQDQERQQQQQAHMLKSAQAGLAQMQRMIGSMEKRIVTIEKRGGIVSDLLKISIQQAKDLINKAQSATTMDEFQSAGLSDMQDLMQTINDEMQKAEMSTQFSAMVKQATRIVAQQQKALASAQKKASSLKVSVDSLLAQWQKAIDDMNQAVTQAQQSFQSGNIEDAVQALKDDVFDAMQTVGNYQQTFGMIANSQRMLAMATKGLASIEKRIASLKKQGKDTSVAELALGDAKDKIQAITDIIAQSDIDPDALMSAIQDAQDSKDQLYSAMYDLTGQQQYNAPSQQSVPGINTQQFQAPPGMQQFFGGQQRGESQNQNGGFQQPSPQIPNGGPQSSGPQGLTNPITAATQTASILEAAQKQIDELRARVKELMR